MSIIVYMISWIKYLLDKKEAKGHMEQLTGSSIGPGYFRCGWDGEMGPRKRADTVILLVGKPSNVPEPESFLSDGCPDIAPGSSLRDGNKIKIYRYMI